MRGIRTQTAGKRELHLICEGETWLILETNAFHRHLKEHSKVSSSRLDQNTHGRCSNGVGNDIFAAVSGGDDVVVPLQTQVWLNPAPAFFTLHVFIPWFSGSSCLTTTVFLNLIFAIFGPVRTQTLSNIQDFAQTEAVIFTWKNLKPCYMRPFCLLRRSFCFIIPKILLRKGRSESWLRRHSAHRVAKIRMRYFNMQKKKITGIRQTPTTKLEHKYSEQWHGMWRDIWKPAVWWRHLWPKMSKWPNLARWQSRGASYPIGVRWSHQENVCWSKKSGENYSFHLIRPCRPTEWMLTEFGFASSASTLHRFFHEANGWN